MNADNLSWQLAELQWSMDALHELEWEFQFLTDDERGQAAKNFDDIGEEIEAATDTIRRCLANPKLEAFLPRCGGQPTEGRPSA